MGISCDCSIDYGDYDSADYWEESFPVARKKYICCECKETIKPGEKHQKEKVVFEGEWTSYRTCLPCHRIRKHYCSGGYVSGELRETISDCLGFDYLDPDPDDDDE